MPAYFGLDIGSSSIKVARIDGKKLILGIAVNPVGKVGIEMNALEKDKLVGAIRQLVVGSKLGTNKVVVSIPESLVFSRVMEFPIVSSAELASAIKWQAEQDIPLSPADSDLSWVVIDKPKRKTGVERMKVLVVAVPKRISAGYIDILSLAGLEPVRAENETLALGRLLVTSQELKEAVLIVDLGAESTKMVLFESGLVKTIYTVKVGGLTLTRSLAQTFGLNNSQAEQYKRVYGAEKSALEGKIYQAMEPVLLNLYEEIGKVKVKTGSSVRIILVGGGSYLKGLVALMSQRFGVEVVVGDVFGEYKVEPSQLKLGVVYGVAVGLATEDES